MQVLYNIAKILHVIGFTTAIGTTVTMLAVYNRMWKLYHNNPVQGMAALRSIEGLQRAAMDGILLAIVAGITMLAIIHWSFFSFLWFHIKLTVIFAILIIGFTYGRMNMKKLHALISGEQQETINDQMVSKLRRNLNSYMIIELILFVTIIVLSVFRFV